MRVKANLSAQIPILGKLANKYPLPLKKQKHIKEINMALINTKYFSYICKGIEPTKYLQTNNNQ